MFIRTTRDFSCAQLKCFENVELWNEFRISSCHLPATGLGNLSFKLIATLISGFHDQMASTWICWHWDAVQLVLVAILLNANRPRRAR